MDPVIVELNCPESKEEGDFIGLIERTSHTHPLPWLYDML